LFSFVAVFFEQGFGPATLIVTQGKTNTEWKGKRILPGVEFEFMITAFELQKTIHTLHVSVTVVDPKYYKRGEKQEWRYYEYGSHMGRRNTSKQRQVQYEKGRKNDIIEISLMNFEERESVLCSPI
jgi:hypothetical protein